MLREKLAWPVAPCGSVAVTVTPIFWSGDSNTDFERSDGLPSNLPALLSAGLSGISIWAADVGGYMSLFSGDRDPEVLARWTELAAFLAVMRTHHGTNPRASVQFDHSPATLAHYRTYARLHTALFPLRRALVDAAAATGLPVCRALLLEFADDPEAWTVEDEFLLGRDLLVAPVIERGVAARRVYLPAGVEWIDLWTGVRTRGGTRVTAAAPLGRIPLYLRSDGVLPTFDMYVDTLVRRAQVSDPEVRTLDDAERSLALLLGADFTGPARLWDGTVVARVAAPTAGDLTPTAGSAHELLPAELVRTWRRVAVVTGRDGTVDCGGWWLRLTSPIPRRTTIAIVGTA